MNQLSKARIVVDPTVMAGKPIVRGTRLTVQYILNLLANGAEIDDIIHEYSGLTREDVLACVGYASDAIDNENYFPLVDAA